MTRLLKELTKLICKFCQSTQVRDEGEGWRWCMDCGETWKDENND